VGARKRVAIRDKAVTLGLKILNPRRIGKVESK
jgi:ribosomal protein L32E